MHLGGHEGEQIAVTFDPPPAKLFSQYSSRRESMTMGVSPFTINKLHLKHYRSIGSCSISPGRLCFLVGPNGSGKSNILDSLRLVRQSLNENLDNALRERGGIAEVRRRSNGHPTHFQISLEFTGGGFGGTYEFQVGAVKGGDFRVTRERCVVADLEFGSKPSVFETRDGEYVEKPDILLPKVTSDRLALSVLSGLPAFRPVFDGLTGVEVFNLYPDLMRSPQKPDPGDHLRRDGRNVASVLEWLQRNGPSQKLTIEEYLAAIVPGIRSVRRKSVGSWETIDFIQDVKGSRSPWTFPASSMSDGTLRALGVLIALFSGDNLGPLSPVGIEEPETALHPAASGILLDAIRDASEARQVFVTSHSPDLLDSETIRADEVVAVRSDAGNTIAGPLDQAGQVALRERLFTAGELMRTDQAQPETHEVQGTII